MNKFTEVKITLHANGITEKSVKAWADSHLKLDKTERMTVAVVNECHSFSYGEITIRRKL